MIKPQKVVSFADRLKQARLSLGARLGREVRQKEVAAEADVTEGAYSQWENGEREPRGREVYERLAAILGVRAGWLAFGESYTTERNGLDITPTDALPKYDLGSSKKQRRVK